MNQPPDSRSIEGFKIAPLARIVERDQVWSRMAAKYGVANPVPPWKSNLDGMCDALDRSGCSTAASSFTDRRADEDKLSATVYSDLPYPENQLVSLAHSLVARGVIDETELRQRIGIVRTRLEG